MERLKGIKANVVYRIKQGIHEQVLELHFGMLPSFRHLT